MRIAITWSPGLITVSRPATSATPFRVIETSRTSSGSERPGDALARGRSLGRHLQLDDLQPLAPQLEQLHEAVLRHLVLDEAEEARRRAQRPVDAEQIEVLLVPRVVDACDHLRHLVAVLRDLGDHDVVLVVPGDREHDVGRPGDPGALEDVDLGRVTGEDHRPELGLELLEPVAPLLDQRHLVPHREERARDARADLPAACHDRVHQTTLASVERTTSVSVAIAVCVGHTV